MDSASQVRPRALVEESDVEDAITMLHETAEAIGAARGQMVKAEAMLRHVKAIVMGYSFENAVSAQEREAYASDRYRGAVEKYGAAVTEFETLRAKRENCALVVSVFQTVSANTRAVRI